MVERLIDEMHWIEISVRRTVKFNVVKGVQFEPFFCKRTFFEKRTVDDSCDVVIGVLLGV